MTKLGPTLVKSGLVYSMKNINTTTSFSLSPVSTKWYHPPSKHPHHYHQKSGWCLLPSCDTWGALVPARHKHICAMHVCVCEKAMHTHRCSNAQSCTESKFFLFKVPLNGNYAPRWTLRWKLCTIPRKKNVWFTAAQCAQGFRWCDYFSQTCHARIWYIAGVLHHYCVLCWGLLSWIIQHSNSVMMPFQKRGERPHI